MSLDKAFEKIITEKEAALLKPAASQIGVALKEYGYLELYVFPSIDSLLGASIALSVLLKSNMDFTVLVKPDVPRELQEPSLLLGYPVHIVHDLRAHRPSALIGLGEKPQGLLHVAVSSSSDSSIAALTAAVFSELTVVGYPSIYGIVAGYWRGLDKGKKASFIGLESSIAEMLKLENKVEEIFSLKLFRWPELPTEEAMARTLDPYFPGLSGNTEECRRLLSSDPRLAKLLGKRLEEAPEQSVAVLGEKLYDILKKSSKGLRRPTDLIGITYHSLVFPLRDLREAAYVLSYYAAKGYAEQLTAIAVDERIVSATALYTYMDELGSIINAIEDSISAKPTYENLNRARIRKLSIDKRYLPIVDKVLRQLGYIGEQEVVGSTEQGDTVVLIEHLLYSLGPGAFLEALRQGCIEYLEESLFARIRRERCG